MAHTRTLQEKKYSTSEKINIVGIYDPAKNDLSMDMWQNSNGEIILKTIEKINNINKIDEKANDIVKGYISALNERSVASLERYLHFPHTRVMLDGESRYWETARKYLDDFQSRLEEDSWHSTELLSVDTEIISKKKCHTRISFKRLRRDGSVINTYHSLYVITEKNKSWGILFGSGTG